MDTLDIDWETLESMPEWAAQMAARDRSVAVRVEVIDPAGVALGDAAVESGTVTMTGGGSEMWVASLSGSDPDWLPMDYTDALDARSGNRVRIWWQEHLPALGGWGEVPVMTGWPHNPDVTDDGQVSWQVTVRDSLLEAKRGGYGGATVELGGKTVPDALDALFAVVAPQLERAFPASTVVLPDVYTLGQNTPDEDWQAIAALAGWQVWSDREGVITAGPLTASTTVDWSEGDGCRLTELRKDTKTTDIINRVVVVSTNSSVSPTITAVADDSDPASPTYVGDHGPWELRVESDAVATQEAADNLAHTTLEAGLRPVVEVTGKCTPRPDLGWGDVLLLQRDRIGIFGPHTLTGFRLSLPRHAAGPELMEVSMSPVVSV